MSTSTAESTNGKKLAREAGLEATAEVAEAGALEARHPARRRAR